MHLFLVRQGFIAFGRKNQKEGTFIFLFRGSAAVAQLTVNQLVAGSNPAPGANFDFLSQH